ncbi:hypothetical protein SAMN05216298_4196 [Glycomyces sambucus]|uniref:ARG and Rhodanese-Phosphatase-superfamily-associated domain-containing protein n=1 Tax=Glycomyces sambucus TaxID=380244 RepID=A0A1G9KQP3_9ACTN|nr:hypothetical protein [Glycomyces sambucus]SDL51914.1 hypothetical protein SAMN05216298_4196 [Glycomyces sambucus]
MGRLTFAGLETRPGQVWGAIRLVPLVRDEPIEGLRMHPGALDEPRYPADDCWYVPHGLTAEWTGDGAGVPELGTALRMPASTVRGSRRPKSKTGHRTRVRFLPRRGALETYLPLAFKAPVIAWPDWSRRAFTRGLLPQPDRTYYGTLLDGLADALRVFEIHPRQCGVLIYVADALSGALITPHPDDYRALHPTLIEDSYSELIWRYAVLYDTAPDYAVKLDTSTISSLSDLRIEAAAAQRTWSTFHDDTLAGGLLDPDYDFTDVYKMADFRLVRYRPAFKTGTETHVGEAILDPQGRPAFLQSFRLSETQVRRGRLLEALGTHDWHLADTAEALHLTKPSLVALLHNSDLDWMLRQDVADHNFPR